MNAASPKARSRRRDRMLDLRERMARAVEMLIAAMDELDADPDMEATGDDEPSLGWTVSGAIGSDSDLEEEHDGREPEVDEMNGDEHDYMLGADDEHQLRQTDWHGFLYGMGTAFVRDDGTLQ